MIPILSLIGVLGAIGIWSLTVQKRTSQRKAFIESHVFPETIGRHLQAKYPHLNAGELKLVEKGLRQYFLVVHRAGQRMAAMPSQAVDEAWHEFILFTRDYANFCQRAFGKFLHHTPAEAMRGKTRAQDGIKTSWQLCCRLEGIDPKNPSKLPLLFALDSKLNIPDGFKYALDCMGQKNSRFCASHIGCGSDGGIGHGGQGSSVADAGHGHGSHGDGGGHGGHGCGGHGCGGGGCGGGGN